MLRYYKRPINYGPEISRKVYQVLPFGVILHLAMSVFTFSTKDIFPEPLSKPREMEIGGITREVYMPDTTSLEDHVFLK